MVAKKSRKKNVLDVLLQEYGDEIIWKFGGARDSQKVEVIPTKSLSLNWAFSGGGIPRGKITQLAGPESSGKTTLCYFLIHCLQELGGTCAILDVENSIDLVYMRQCRIDVQKNLIIAQPDFGEQALAIIEKIVLDGRTDLVVLDSVATLIPKAELAGKMTDMQVGLLARILAKATRRLNVLLKGSRTAVVFTNQLRDKIGSFGWGPQTSTPGGRALKHAAAVCFETKRITPIKSGAKQVGFNQRVKNTKNKIGMPFRDVQIPIIYGFGIDDRLDLINLAIASKALKKQGSIYYVKDHEIGNGWREAYSSIVKSKRATEYVETEVGKLLSKWTEAGTSKEEETVEGES